jgi:hypothetical protein
MNGTFTESLSFSYYKRDDGCLRWESWNEMEGLGGVSNLIVRVQYEAVRSTTR